VVVPVPADVGEGGVVVVDAGVDDPYDDALALRSRQAAGRRPVPDRGRADPRRPGVGQELELEVGDDAHDAGQPRHNGRLRRSELDSHAVEHHVVAEPRLRVVADCGLDRARDLGVLGGQVVAVRPARRTAGVEPPFSGHLRIGRRESRDPALVLGEGRSLQKHDVEVAVGRGARRTPDEGEGARGGADEREMTDAHCSALLRLSTAQVASEMWRRISTRYSARCQTAISASSFSALFAP
jgi:hypothetical protein